ncbi:MAG: hypothetical protein ACTSQG_10930 [Promethearchaeota archaeon]
MKIFGYIDDLINWFFSWQYSIGQWNLIIIPIEVFIIIFVFSELRTKRDP